MEFGRPRLGDLPDATATPTVAQQFTTSEAQALALQWVTANYGSLDGHDCGTPELNELRSRWTTVCTERSEGAHVRVVAVDAVTGAATDLETAATAATNTPANTATATATKTPQ